MRDEHDAPMFTGYDLCTFQLETFFPKHTLTQGAPSVQTIFFTSLSFTSSARSMSEDRKVTFEASNASKVGLVWPVEI